MTAAIILSDLVFQYDKGSFTLSCPHLSLAQGELSLITGANGSGKTTLSKLMCGILKPGRGEVRIFGRSTKVLSLGEIGGQMGYLFQDPSRQLFAGTVWKEMTFVHDLLGKEQKASAEKALHLLERFGLSALKERNIYHLSGGEKQRLAICTILMGGAQFLILDEPTVGLDKQNREILYTIIDDLLEEGRGVAVITHENELIKRYPKTHDIKVEDGQVTL